MSIKGMPKYVVVAATDSGDTKVLDGVAGQVIRVMAGLITSDSSVNIKFRSATTDKTGVHYVSSRGGFAMNYNPLGVFETAAGEDLNINLSAGSVNVGGTLTYVQGEP